MDARKKGARSRYFPEVVLGIASFSPGPAVGPTACVVKVAKVSGTVAGLGIG